MKDTQITIDTLNKSIQPIHTIADYDVLLSAIGNAEIVLLGEATHGTDNFYESRAEISKRLIIEKGFTAIAVEGDWPDVYQIHRYITDNSEFTKAEQVLQVFKRFPTWMWANEAIRKFIKWLKEYNIDLLKDKFPISFYGLDLYSLHSSIEAVIHYLESIDPPAAELARQRYDCLYSGNFNPESYASTAAFNLQKNCRKEVIKQLIDLQQHAYDYLQKDGTFAQNAYFNALQNARLIKNAEEYYRTQLQGDVSSWNLRDRYMFETLLSIKVYQEQLYQKPAKIIVWAHNSHVGDARATEMSVRGEFNIGQLAKEYFHAKAISIGYTTYKGTVTAASRWGSKPEYKRINPALTDSYENLFNQLRQPDFLLLLKNKEVNHILNQMRLERAIGVIYRPDSERQSHYFYTRLPQQFDAILHFDRTKALKPLIPIGELPADELPETYPFGV